MAAAPFVLRPVGPADQDFLCELYASTRAEEMAATGWPRAEIDAFLRMQWEAQRADYTRRHPGADHEVIVVGGVSAGRLWVDRSPGEIRLLDIALVPDHRGQGIGTRLLLGLQDEARRSGRVVGHAVVKENVRALGLYQRLGFTIRREQHPTHWFMEWVPRGRRG